MAIDTPAARLIGGAWAYLRAAELLEQDDPNGHAWAVCYVNIAFAIELGLKSFLRAKGGTPIQQRALRHDLRKALAVCLQQGFQPSHPGVQPLVDELSPYHRDMSLRYFVGDAVILYRVSEVIPVVRSLLVDLHKQGETSSET